MKIPIGLVDDHQLFLRSLGLMLSSFENYVVTIEALGGKDLQAKLKSAKILPKIILVDVNMPVIDGIETAKWLQAHYPEIKLVALTVNNSEKAIIGMIRAGCCAYLLKDIHPDELEKALNEISSKGFYNADISNINYRRLILYEDETKSLNITDKEKEFLELVCEARSNKQIIEIMGVSDRTIDGYCNSLFAKLGVHSRVGLVIEAIKREIVNLNK